MRKKSKFLFSFIISIMFICNITTIYAEGTEIEKPVLPAPANAAILIEQHTGKVLFAENEHERMYPASTTKILTALVALDYLEKDEIIVVGDEIHTVPYDSSIAEHAVGEHITVENLMRGLMIPSGNESACVFAREVARKVTSNPNISYNDAERTFSDLMNKKAKSLGALNSNFVNPHGYHHDSHYTTAYDMALISREAMKNDLIAKSVQEIEFHGNSLGDNNDPDLKTLDHNWGTHNELLIQGNFYFPYANGIKTGFHDQAGHCLASSASKDGKDLISVVFFSQDPGRWQNSIYLFNYGFDNFNYETVQEKDKIVDSKPVKNRRLGEEEEVEIYSSEEFVYFLSAPEFERIEYTINYNQEVISSPEDDDEITSDMIKAPLSSDTVVGTISYILDGEELYTGDIYIKDELRERSFKSDMDYRFSQFKSKAFSLKALPFWIGGIVIIILIIFLISKIRGRRSNNSFRRRY